VTFAGAFVLEHVALGARQTLPGLWSSTDLAPIVAVWLAHIGGSSPPIITLTTAG
jgi:hypothetical protein